MDSFASIALIVATFHLCSCSLGISLEGRLVLFHSRLGEDLRIGLVKVEAQIVVAVIAA